jgi:acyl-CoA reductase-like NAD-dependent aldehyde dehydrogenase
MERFSMVIGGKAVGALSGRTFESQNPYTGEAWAVVPDGDPSDVDAAVAAAQAALVWTKDIHRGHRVAAKIKAGTVWINAYRVVAPSVPFGGFGNSGLGRENGLHAIDEYLAEKAVWVELTGGTRDPFTLG